MRVITNEDLVARRKKTANILAPVAMILLLGGLVLNIMSINNPELNQGQFYLILLLLGVGFILSTISSTLVNRWVREPRADQSLEQVLKGFDNKHVLFNYTTGTPHVLVAQNQVYAITTKNVDGEISVKNDRWRRKFTLMRFLRFFAEEGLGSPTVEAEHNLGQLAKFLKETLPEEEDLLESVPMESLIVFTNPKAELTVEESKIPIMLASEMKRYIRKNTKGSAIKAEHRKKLIEVLRNNLGESNN